MNKCLLKRNPAMLVFLLVFCAGFLRAEKAEEEKKESGLVLTIDVKKEIVITEKGKKIKKTVPADNISKGETVTYIITYKNAGKKVIKNASVVDPVPKGMVCIPVSVSSGNAKVFFSIDNLGTFQEPPVKYLAKNSDGKDEELPAPPEMITHIKWQITKDILPGKGGDVTFKAKMK